MGVSLVSLPYTPATSCVCVIPHRVLLQPGFSLFATRIGTWKQMSVSLDLHTEHCSWHIECNKWTLILDGLFLRTGDILTRLCMFKMNGLCLLTHRMKKALRTRRRLRLPHASFGGVTDIQYVGDKACLLWETRFVIMFIRENTSCYLQL